MESVNANRSEILSDWDSLHGLEISESAEDTASTRDKKLGRSILELDEAIYGNGGHHYDMNERLSFTPDEIRNYRKDSFQPNIEYLERVNADESLKQSYREMMSEFPSLRSVVLDQIHRRDKNGNSIPDETIQNASSGYIKRIGNEIHQKIEFNFKNPDIYLGSDKREDNGDLRGFYCVIAEIALRTGARPKEIANNRALVSTFILAHEFGHALDFQRNFLQPAIDNARAAGHKNNIGQIALPEAFAAEREARMEDMAGKLDGALSFDDGNGANKNAVLRTRLLDLDLQTPQEKKAYCAKSYRTSRSENFADTFAMNFVMKHYDRFFYDPRKGEAPNGRVKTNLYGETKTIGEEIIPLLDFHAGKHVSIKKISTDGKVQDIDGYLCNSLRTNEPLKLNLNGDSSSTNIANYKALGKVVNVRMKQEKGEDGAINTFYLIMDDHSTIKISTVGSGEAPKIDVDVSEFMNRYGIQENSLLTLLKTNVNVGESSAVSTGGVLAGRLARNNNGGLIEVGSSIYLRGDQKLGGNGGNTSRVRRIYRKWRRFFIETNTSTYELLPYIEKK